MCQLARPSVRSITHYISFTTCTGIMPRSKRIAREAAPRINISLDAISRTLARPVCVDTPSFLVGVSAMFTLSESILAEEEGLSIAPYTRFLFDPDTGAGSVVPKIHPSYEAGAHRHSQVPAAPCAITMRWCTGASRCAKRA